MKVSKPVIPITATERQTALRFAQQQPTQAKAQQVYLNTLAVLAVKHCLDILEIPTDLSESDSWNPFSRLTTNQADLQITHRGRLECHPVGLDAPDCTVPMDALDDRLGYVVVQIDRPYQEATLLGFVPTVTHQPLALSQLQPLTELLIHLETIAAQPQPARSVTYLQAWFDRCAQTVADGIEAVVTDSQTIWQTVEALLGRTTANLALMRGVKLDTPEKIQRLVEQLYVRRTTRQQSSSSQSQASVPPDPDAKVALAHLIQTTTDEELRWKAAEILWTLEPEHPAAGMRRVMDLGMYLAGQAIALMVAVLQTGDRAVSVLIRVVPMSGGYLPPGLDLAVLTEDGEMGLTTQARERDNMIELKLCGNFGDRFSIRVMLDADQITEYFVI